MATITNLGFVIDSKWDGTGVRNARDDLDKLRQDMRQLSGAALHIDVIADTQNARREIDKFKQENAQETFNIDVNVDTAAAQAKIDQLKTESAAIDISFDINEASYIAAGVRIDILTRNRTVDIYFDVHNNDGMLSINNTINQITNSMDSAGNSGSRMGRMIKLGAAIAGAAIAVLPGAISAVGAALLTLPGLVGIGLGAFFLSKIQAVKDEFTSLKDTIMQVGTRAAEPMKMPLINAMKDIKQYALDNESVFKETFTQAAKSIEPLKEGLLGFITHLMPGFNDALSKSAPLFWGLAEGMKRMGQSMGQTFQILSGQAEAFGMTWNLILTYTGRIIEDFAVGAAMMVNNANISMADTFISLELGIEAIIRGLRGFISAVAQSGGGLDLFKNLGLLLEQILPPIGRFYAAISEALGPALDILFPAIGRLAGVFVDSLIPVLIAITPFLTAAANGISTMMKALEPVMPVLGPVIAGLWLLKAALMAHPIAALVVGLVMLAGYLVDLEQKTGIFSRTWNSAWESMKGPIESTKEVLGVWWENIKKFGSMMAELFGPKFTTMWHNMRDAIAGAWEDIRPALQSLGDTLGPLWEQAKPFLIGFGAALVTVYSIVWDVFNNAIKPVFGMIGDLIAVIVQVIKGFVQILTGVFQTIKGVVELVFNFFKTIVGLVKGIFTGDFSMFTEGLGGMGNAIKDIFGGIMNVLKGALSIIDGIWDAIYAIFKGAIGIIIGYVKGFVTGIISALDAMVGGVSGGIKNAWNAAWNGIKAVVQAVWDWMQRTWDSIINGIKAAWDAVGGALSSAWNATWNAVKNVVEIAWGFISGIWDGIKDIWNKAWSAIKEAAVTAFMQITLPIRIALAVIITAFIVWKNVLVAVWSAIWDKVKEIVAPIWDWIKNTWASVINGVKALWDIVSGAIVNAWNVVWANVKAVVDPIWSWIKNTWDNIITGIKVIWDTISAAVVNAWNVVWANVKAIVDPIWAWIKNTWDSIINGIKNTWDIVSGALSAAWNAVWAAVKSVVDPIWNWIKDTWDSIINGVKNTWEVVSGTLKNLWNAVWNWVKDTAKAIWDWIQQKWDEFTGTITRVVEGMRDRIQEIWSTFWNAIKQTAIDVWEGIKTGFNDFKDRVVETVEGIVTKIEEIWKKITGIFKGPIDDVKGIWNGVAGTFGLPQFDLAEGGPVVNRATGGAVFGAGNSTSDSIRANLSNDEHVWTAAEVRAAGGHNRVEEMRREVLMGHRQNIGVGPVARDNNLAAGGRPVTLDPAVSMAREKGDGRAYVYGGTGPDGFDCSGYMSAIFNSLTGRSLWQRSFSTESDFDALGFQKGLGAGFSVGIMRGGGGPNSHMAGTLDGANVESGGGHSSTRYGGPAAGADHGQFPIKYHLPIMDGAFVSGGGGSPFSGPTAEQIAAHKAATDSIKAIVDSTNTTSVTKQFGVAKAVLSGIQAGVNVGTGRNIYDMTAPAGDTHAAGTHGVGMNAIGKLDDKLASMKSNIGGMVPDGDRLRIIEEAMRVTNTPPPSTREAWLAGMNTLISRESGWNAGARNDTDSNAAAGNNSVGLAQVIPTTFAANKAPGYDNIYGEIDNVAASINYIKRTYGSIENVQQANANMPAKGYSIGTRNAAAGWQMVGENGPELMNFRGGEQVKSFNEIITALKDSATGEGRALQTKLSADLQAFADKVVAETRNSGQLNSDAIKAELQNLIAQMSADAVQTGQRLQVTFEDTLQRLAALAGIHVTIPVAGGTPEDNVNQIVQQVIPQLEMLIRQGVGTH